MSFKINRIRAAHTSSFFMIIINYFNLSGRTPFVWKGLEKKSLGCGFWQVHLSCNFRQRLFSQVICYLSTGRHMSFLVTLSKFMSKFVRLLICKYNLFTSEIPAVVVVVVFHANTTTKLQLKNIVHYASCRWCRVYKSIKKQH